MKKINCIILLLLFTGQLLFSQTFKVSLEASIGKNNFDILEKDNKSYFAEAENKTLTQTIPGVKVTVGLNKLKLSAKLSYVSQSMKWDSVNVYPWSDDRVWSIIVVDYNRLQLHTGVGYEIPFNKFYVEPEFAVFFTKQTKFNVSEIIHNPPFYNYPPAEYENRRNEFGIRASAEFGYYLTEHFTLGIRPAYLFSEWEIFITNKQDAGSPATQTKGFAIGIDVGYKF